MSKLPKRIKRITVEIAMDSLPFATLSAVSAAIATLEEAAQANENLIVVVDDVRGAGKLRKKRRDAKAWNEKALQPQAAAVLDALERRTLASVDDLATDLGLGVDSVRAQLAVLHRYRLVDKREKHGRAWTWVILPKPEEWWTQ